MLLDVAEEVEDCLMSCVVDNVVDLVVVNGVDFQVVLNVSAVVNNSRLDEGLGLCRFLCSTRMMSSSHAHKARSLLDGPSVQAEDKRG